MAKNSKFTRIVTQDNFVTEKIDVIQNNLLGDYDDEGNYSIAPQIIKELIELNKSKRTSFANSIFCVGSLLGYGELVFELLFDAKTYNGKSASATLYLLEDVDKINGYLQNTLKTKLGDYSNNVAENFVEETYKFFNVSTADDDSDDAEVLERKLSDDLDNEDSFIIAKKQYSLMLEKLTEEKFLDAYGKYFTTRISVLTKQNTDFSQAVLTSFNKQYTLIQNVFLKEKNYKILNELLDKCVEEFSGTSAQFVLEEKEYSKQIKPALDTFVESVNKLNEKFENKALNLLDKDDRKKVEEIHEEQEMNDKENAETVESQQSVENIVNSVQTNDPIVEEKIEQQTQEKKPLEEKQPKTAQEYSDKHFIEEIMNKSSDSSIQHDNDQSFYDSFKDTRSRSQKVVDTSRSHHIDTPNLSEELAVNSLKDRINRLEKFKSQPQSSNTYAQPITQEQKSQKESHVTNLFDTLAKEKVRKEEQFGVRNRRNREEVENISQKDEFEEQQEQLTQREREELLRQQEQYYDPYEM